MRTHEFRFRSHAAAPVAAFGFLVASLLVEPVLAQALLSLAALMSVLTLTKRPPDAPLSVAAIRAQELALERRRIRHSVVTTSAVAFGMAAGSAAMLWIGRLEGAWALLFWFAVLAGTLTVGNGIALLMRLQADEAFARRARE